jgi:CDP-diacylglycerol--glycerol-3-phosphate 3-phosphatidyltransferase
MLVSYERARAESLDYVAKGGLMERAERVIAIAIGLAFHAVLIPVLWVMLVLTVITAVQRFVMVWRQASADRPVDENRRARWKAWRAAHAPGDLELGRRWRRRTAEMQSERRANRRATRTRP